MICPDDPAEHIQSVFPTDVMLPGSEQLVNRLTCDNEVWTASRVHDARIRAIAQGVVHGRDKVAGVNRISDWVTTDIVARSVDASSLDAASGKDCAVDLTPVIAARTFVDFGRSSKFTRPGNQCFVQYPAFCEIFP